MVWEVWYAIRYQSYAMRFLCYAMLWYDMIYFVKNNHNATSGLLPLSFIIHFILPNPFSILFWINVYVEWRCKKVRIFVLVTCLCHVYVYFSCEGLLIFIFVCFDKYEKIILIYSHTVWLPFRIGRYQLNIFKMMRTLTRLI